MIVIPAIDILDGKVVRLTKGDYKQVTVYDDDAVSQAQKFIDAGFSRIHIVDLNGARDGSEETLKVIESIKNKNKVFIQTGGGVRNLEDIKQRLDAGADGVISTSLAVREPAVWIDAIKTFGEKACILGLDVKHGQIAYSGWEQTSDHDALGFLQRFVNRGLTQVLSTDVTKDGTLSGPNIEWYHVLQGISPKLKVIASGGVATYADLRALDSVGVWATVVGKAYYEQKVTLDELIHFN